MPHGSGDGTPAGGGTWAPTILNIWPTNPSGVQLARPMRPPGRHDPEHLGSAARSGSGTNITPKVDRTASNSPSLEREVLGVGHARLERAGRRPRPGARAPSSSSVDVVGGRRRAQPRRAAASEALPLPAATSSTCRAGRHVDGLAERLADDLERGADHGVVAAGPGGLLLALMASRSSVRVVLMLSRLSVVSVSGDGR